MLSQCCFMVRSPQWQRWWGFKERVCPRPSLSSSPCRTQMLKMVPSLIYGLWQLRPLICEPLCLCLWNMAYFLHLICRQMDNMVWQGLFRCLLFPAQSMMECNYQEWRTKPWGQRPFPVSLPGIRRPTSLYPVPHVSYTDLCMWRRREDYWR